MESPYYCIKLQSGPNSTIVMKSPADLLIAKIPNLARNNLSDPLIWSRYLVATSSVPQARMSSGLTLTNWPAEALATPDIFQHLSR